MKEILIGEIIKQRRLELHLTQEELCEGICEPPTMSRIENGKQTPSRSKLNLLLQRLGLPSNKYYALMSENELEIERLKTEIVSCNMRRDSHEGLVKLQKLIDSVADDDHLTQQFILRSKALLGYEENGQIVPYCMEEQVELLNHAIRLTIPFFDTNNIGKHWYSLEEMKIINQLGITYGDNLCENKAIDIYYQFLKHIQKRPLQVNSDTVPVIILLYYNYSKFLCHMEHYHEAIDIANEGWEFSIRWGRSTFLGGLFYVLGESYYNLQQMKNCKQFYLQSYYAYINMNNESDAQIIKDIIRNYFPNIRL